MYVDRFYRAWVDQGELKQFTVKIRESDLLILCDRALPAQAERFLRDIREEIENHIADDHGFVQALQPYPVGSTASPRVRQMAQAGRYWGVGPMAAVAGAVAQAVGEHLLSEAATVIVENGGDIFVQASRKVRFALYAGAHSPFSDRVAFTLNARDGLGVCTSSGTVGPSLSFGKADAVVAIAPDAAFADAAATALANRIDGPKDVQKVIDEAAERRDLTGLVACCGDQLGLWGELELTRNGSPIRRPQ
jgi:ApbE superfamily uncharacterized protein (UPF0280 family)